MSQRALDLSLTHCLHNLLPESHLVLHPFMQYVFILLGILSLVSLSLVSLSLVALRLLALRLLVLRLLVLPLVSLPLTLKLN